MPAAPRRPSYARALTLAVCLMVALLGYVPAASADGASRWDSVRSQALARVDAVERAVSTGRLTDSLAAAAELIELQVEPAATAPVALPGLPALISGPVGRLLGAIEAARAGVPQTLRVPAAELADIRTEEQAAAAVDRQALYGSGLAVTAAIDEALPSLRAYAATLPESDERVVGCDQLEQGPVCIGGNGANVITGDRALVIDLGGDDTHNHSAGGAWLANPASVTIDLGGNDKYETTAPTAGGSFPVQGAGVIGIGVLVDAAGNDAYTATGADNASTPYAHGAGGGTG
ncbi:MAG: hypothetical protein ACRDHM_08285, partial [Actinomycetota bacterium]